MKARSYPAVEVRELWYWYEGPALALQDVNLAIECGDYVAIVGQNGSGKTTLAKHFNGLLRPKLGSVWLDGENTAHRTVGELARRVGYVFQNPHHQIFGSSVREELAFGPRNLGLEEAEVQERVLEALKAFDLEPFANAPPALLSFGLKRKVTLASVYTMRPQVLVLDEPTLGLDRGAARDLMGHVERLHRNGHTIVLITHDMRLVAECASRMVVLHQGRLLAYDYTRAVFQRSELLRQAFLVRPQISELARDLKPYGVSGDALSVGELYADLEGLLMRRGREDG